MADPIKCVCRCPCKSSPSSSALAALFVDDDDNTDTDPASHGRRRHIGSSICTPGLQQSLGKDKGKGKPLARIKAEL